MKKLLLLLLMVGLTVQATWGQIDIEQVEINGGETLSVDELMGYYARITPIKDLMQLAAYANHVANITMRGNNNTAVITQQNGAGNIGAINIFGDGNQAGLIQNGSNLLSLIDIKGDANRLQMNQSGTDLGNLVQVDGSGLNITLTQDEAGFRYMQGGSATAIMITSSSDYVPIIIRNN